MDRHNDGVTAGLARRVNRTIDTCATSSLFTDYECGGVLSDMAGAAK
jgi:hypothetical protein